MSLGIKQGNDASARAIGDRALGELFALNARLGRFERLEILFAETKDRVVTGPATEHLTGAREGLWMMRNQPERAFLCGPLAVDSILAVTRDGYVRDRRTLDAKSTQRGTSLAQMQRLAEDLKLPLHMAFRTPGAEVIVPALVHWRAGHFAALIRAEQGRYLVRDPTFGDELWVSRAALDEEASGYMLVRPQAWPEGWRQVQLTEGEDVWGKGQTDTNDPTQTCTDGNCPVCPECGGAGGGSGGGGPPPSPGPPSPGMSTYTAHLMVVSLNLRDTPVGYAPPRGPSVYFAVTYSQREAYQPQTFTFSHLGPKWMTNWMSYVEDDPAVPSATAHVALRGGGRESYQEFNATTQAYAPGRMTQAVLVRTSPSPIRYERRFADGSIEVFAQPDSNLTAPRRVFMTESRDRAGNTVTLTYDAQLRIVALSDAIGQVTTVAYDDPGDSRRITRVTDPFGRFATFQYDANGRLAQITDVMGMASSFTYDAGDFITALTTPYGTSRFTKGEDGQNRWLEMIDPVGGRERLEYRREAPISTSEPAGDVPAGEGVSFTNNWLQFRNTFYWSKLAMARAPRDVASAQIFHWLHTPGPLNQTSGVLESTRRPLEGRIWFLYPGQPNSTTEGSSRQPTVIARVLDTGASQIWRTEYNALGRVTSRTDPLGRRTSNIYAANAIDLLEVRHTTGTLNDLLATYGSYTTQHRAQSTTDASGQTTTYTYNGQGQLLTSTTPTRSGITENRTTTYSYDANGYLQSVTGPAIGAATAYTYDEYGRRRTVADSEGYVVVTDYDVLDRPTKVTYPDGTYEQTVYSRLDPQDQRDRRGRWRHTYYDDVRRPVLMRDPSDRSVIQQWCTCGSLEKIVDSNGNGTSWERDVQGRPTKDTRADGRYWQWTYESKTSRVKSRTDPKGQITTYTYAHDNKLSQVVYTNATVSTPSVSFAYDLAYDRIVTVTDGTGTTSYTYYPVTSSPSLGAGKLHTVDGPLTNDTVTYSYDELGRITTSGLNVFPVTRGYDSLGRVVSLAASIGTFEWSYLNATDEPTQVLYPNGQVTSYTYFDNLGDQRLREIKHLQTASGSVLSQFNYTYDPVGNVMTWQQQFAGNPAKAYLFGYDAADQLVSALQKDVSTQQILTNYGYSYDLAGNRTLEARESTATTAQYNSRNELTQQVVGGKLPVAGLINESATVTVNGTPAAVDASNLFRGAAQLGSGTQQFTVVATDPSGNIGTSTYEVPVNGTATTFLYDPNGNLCAKDGTTCGNGNKTYEWDAENRLVAVKLGGNTLASFSYDGFGRRVQKTAGGVTHLYVYDGEDVIEERISSGQTYGYVHGPGTDRPLSQRDQAGQVSYYLADHLGSIVQMTNSAGGITLTREYDPWGNLIQGSSIAGFGFTGREWDPEIGAHYYRARYYDQSMGRFLSEDPIGFSGGNNFHAYVSNNPVAFTDPTGLARDCDAEHIACFRRCFNSPALWPCKYQNSCHYRYCAAKCLAEFMECVAEESARKVAEACLEHPAICALIIIIIICPKPVPVPA